jgi:hypothetical protein
MLGSLALSSCTKNDDNTIALIGTEYYIDDILSVIPSSVQTRFFADFGSIPEGPVPPKVEGSYVMSPKQRVSSNVDVIDWPLNVVENNTWLRFSNQHNGIVKMDLNEATETKTDTVFVCGNGNAFTIYFIENKEYEMAMGGQTYHARVKRGIVMKGQVTSDGLSDFRYATVIMETEDDSNGIFTQYPPGSYFIYKDGDGVARNEEW